MLSRFPAKLKIPALILGSFLLSFGIVACVETTGSDPEAARAEHEATRLREGEAILSDCIATQCSTLDLDGKRLADYGAINGLTHVKVLMLSYTDFDDLSDIAGMTQLTELHIGQTALTDLSGLSSVPNLRLLHAQSNYSVSDFTPHRAANHARRTGCRELADDLGCLCGIAASAQAVGCVCREFGYCAGHRQSPEP